MGKRTDAILDTGADLSIFSETLFSKLPESQQHKIQASRIPQLKGVTGHDLQILGSITLPISIDKMSTDVIFEVVKGVTKPILLGSDFLSKAKATLDYENRHYKLETK